MVISFPGDIRSRLQKIRCEDTGKRVNTGVTIIQDIFKCLSRGSMDAVSQEANEWTDGFLFGANKPILDFLNTKPVLADGPTELLADPRALERWLIASGTVTSAKAKATLRSWRNSTEAAAFPEQLIAFREKLREAVLRIESGSSPSDAFITEVNSLLL